MAGKESRTYHVNAVVLRHLEYGEADRILTLYTLERGKISAIAKGVRKIRSHKAGHLMPFSQTELFLAKGRNLAVVSQAQALKTFENLRSDLIRTAYAAYVVELVDRFSYDDSENRLLFNLLTDTLERLDQCQQPPTTVHYYEMHLMDLLGFRPELTRCVGCGEQIRAVDQYFSARLGGALCPNCMGKDPHAWHISMNALKYLRFFQRSPWSKVKERVIPEAIEVEIKTLLERYLTYLLEYSLKTPPFLEAMK
jgi:DNA repair protein RecO (recombination protein O)